MRNPTNN